MHFAKTAKLCPAVSDGSIFSKSTMAFWHLSRSRMHEKLRDLDSSDSNLRTAAGPPNLPRSINTGSDLVARGGTEDRRGNHSPYWW